MLIVTGHKEKFAAALKGLVEDSLQRATGMAEKIKSVYVLEAHIEKLKIEKERREEEFARKEREIEHKVGLERKRQEFEIASASKEATLKVREENLAADKKRFEDQMTFHEKRFTEEVGYLKEMISEVMKRLPDVNVELEGAARGKSRR